MSEVPKHSRSAPAEWAELLAESKQNLLASSVSQTVRQNMYATADQLPDEILEANRYYALGIVTCEYARQVAIDTNRNSIVNRAARIMAQRSAETAVKDKLATGIRFTDLHAAELETAADPLAPVINRQLEPPVRLLADALNTVGIVRIRLAEADRFGWDTEAGAPLDDASRTRRLYRRGEPIASLRVTQNGLAGAMSVYRRAVGARMLQDDTINDDPNPRIFATMNAAELRNLQPLAVTRKVASLRIDEHGSPLLDELLVGDTTGNLRFRRDRLSLQPPAQLVEDSLITGIHTSRLTCPALQVEGAILQSLQLIPDIVIRAQELVLEA